MTTILKGDTSKAITIALSDGFDYSGKTVVVEYQGVRRSFSNAVAGGDITFSFAAEETAPMSLGTYPVRVWIEGGGEVVTVHNADVKLCVTDCIADVHGGGAIYLDVHGGLHGIEGLPERYTDDDLRRKINEILRRGGGVVAALLLCATAAFGASVEVQTAPKGTIYNDQPVVTNVTVDVSDKADKTNTYSKAETDAKIVELAPPPGNYNAVSNAAMRIQWLDDIAEWYFFGKSSSSMRSKMLYDDESGMYLGYDPNFLMSDDPRWGSQYGGNRNTFKPFAYKCEIGDVAKAATNYTDEAVGRIDVPEWPVQLITTNTPLIFADGQDTNVASIALQAQPTNYTSLSFLHPVSYYLPNRFSLFELGNDYQIVGSQWFQVGRYLYAQNPENIVFVGSGRHRSLQDYLDACAPETLADLLSCYVPTNGGGRIHGDLEIDGRLTAGELITITNSDIHAKGFQVVNKVLTADGLTASNGMVRLNCARFVLGFGTPRIHLETNTLSAITYGGTWDHPEGSMQELLQSVVQEFLAGDPRYQSIEDRDPYVRYNDVKKSFFDWDLKSLPVNAGPLKHFDLQTGKTHYFTDTDVGREGIELRIYTNTHVRVVYDFETAPPSSVYVYCGGSADNRATILSNGSGLLYPTAGQRTLFEIEPLSGGTFMVKETALTFMDNVGSWQETNYGTQEEEP